MNDVNHNEGLKLLVIGLDGATFDVVRPMIAAGELPNLAALMQKPSWANKWDGPYLKRAPKDPWGNPYKYVCPGRHGPDFDLSSLGADGRDGGGDDIVSWEEKRVHSF